jgi:O-antigen/teichoic acid export membrane protein
MLIAAGTFCIQFIFQLINAILAAHQEPAKADFFNLLGQALVLVSILILIQTTAGSLKILIFALNFLPVLVLVVASLILFSVKFKAISPTIKHIDFRYARNILKIGGVFFTIQIGTLILFQTDNIIISKLLGPEAVTKFNIAYKLYSVIILFFSIIITPFWSAFTEAWVKKDYVWIKKSINRLRKIWLFTAFVISPVFFLISGYLFKIWLGHSVSISTTVSFLMMIYSISYTCLALNCYFLNGIGKLRVQLLLYVFVIFTNPLLCIILGRMFGIEGVIIANIIAFLFMNIILWIQNDKLIKQEATGIWDK